MGSRPREGGFAKEKLYSFLNYFFSSLCKPQKYLIIAWPQSRQHPPPQNTQVDDRCVGPFQERVPCLEAPGSCPGFLSQAPGPLPAGAVSISTLILLRMLRQGPLVVFRLQSSRSTMQA